MPGLEKRSSSKSLSKRSSSTSTVSRQSSLTKKSSVTSRPSLTKAATVTSPRALNEAANLMTTYGKKKSSVTSLTKKASLSKRASNGSLKVVLGKGARVKKPARLFEFDDSGTPPKKKKKKKGKANKEAAAAAAAKEPERELLFRKGEYVAVRNEEDGFYLCRTLQAVYDTTKRVKIWWLEQFGASPNQYAFGYTGSIPFIDYQDADAFIIHVHLKRLGKQTAKVDLRPVIVYELTDRDQHRVDKALTKAINREKGIIEESEDEDDEEEEGEEEEEEEEQPKKKKDKKAKKTPAKKRKPALKKTASKIAAKKAAAKKKKDDKKKKEKAKAKDKPKKQAWTEAQKKNPNLRLTPNPKVKVWNQEPLLYTTEKVPFVSTTAHSKLVHRAVMLNDTKLLQKLVDDLKQVAKVDARYSSGWWREPMHIGIDKLNKTSVQILCKELFKRDAKKKPRPSEAKSMLQEQGTGRYNYRSLGVPVIRRLAMSRGSKEGNNAFTKDLGLDQRYADISQYMQYGLKKGVKKEFLEGILAASGQTKYNSLLHDQLWIAVRMGHRKLAAQLMADKEKTGMTSFNSLHKDVLTMDSGELKPFRAASVRKKPWDNLGITPIHCAAINPNVKFLASLLNVLPEYSIMDQRNRRPIHYAAACEGTGPLDFFMTRGQDPEEVDNSGYTALMIACEANRPKNVEFLLKSAKENPPPADEFSGQNKYGMGGVNRPVMKPQNNKYSYTPLHMAAEEGHLAVVKILVEYGADLNKELSASKNKKSPLMLAASVGHLDVVKYLISKAALVEQKDKLKKTALIYAVQNGFAHIVSYLLSLGANPNQADTSGNTPTHYAAGYGWYFCLKVLLDAGGNANTPNDWKTTPLGVAFLKGHVGLADMLLEQPGVDINFKDEKGLTLVGLACASPLEEGLLDQLEYLINKKKADCTIRDATGNTPLHYLADNDIFLKQAYPNNLPCPKAMDLSVKIANLLISKSCDPMAKNEDGITAVMNAVTQGNGPLVKFLVSEGGGISDVTNKDNQNMLHLMANQCMTYQMAPLLNAMAKTMSKAQLKSMAEVVDKNGMTPLLLAAYKYRNWDGKGASGPPAAEEDEDEDEDEEEEEEDEIELSEPEDVDEEEEEDPDQDAEADPMDTGDDEEEKEEEEPEEEPPEDEESEVEEEEHEDEPVDADEATKIAPDAQDQQWEWGRDFLKALVKLCSADINATVQKKRFEQGVTLPVDEAKHYMGDVGKYGIVHMLVRVSQERPLKSGAEYNTCPGLTTFLALKPPLDLKDVQGRTPLIQAILNNTVPQALKLIEAGADVNLASDDKDSDGKASPLILAARMGMQKVVEELCKRKADVTAVDCRNKYTPLHYAVTHTGGNKDPMPMLEALIKAKVVVNARDKKLRTALHLAVNANLGGADASSEVETFLIDNGADVHAKDKRGRVPLHYAFVKIGMHEVKNAIDPIELCSTLTAAMDPTQIDAPDEFRQTPLHRAAYRGAGVCCVHLLQKKGSINATDRDKNTPLGLAVSSGHESCTIMLIQKNANIKGNIYYPPVSEEEEAKFEAEEEEGLTEEEKEKRRRMKPKPAWVWKPLKKPDHLAKETKIVPIFQKVVETEWQGVTFMMLDMLADFGIPYSQPIEAALITNKFNLAMTLIRKAKDAQQLKAVNDDGSNLFHVLCYNASCSSQLELQLKVAKMLRAQGVSLTDKDSYGCTPLHYACLQQNTTLVKFIMLNVKKVDLEEKDSFGRTPLAACFWNFRADKARMTELSKELTKKGAKLDVLCDYPATDVPLFGAAPQQQDHQYRRSHATAKITPLMLAICHGDYDLAKLLVENGASINSRSSDLLSPIMFAVRANSLHLTRLLLNLKYDKKAAEEKAASGPGIQKQRKRKGGFMLAARLAKKAKRPKKDDDDDDDDDDEEDEDDEKEEMVVEAPQEGIDLNFKKFPKTSNVDLKVADIQGWTVVHHIVCPLHVGTYDNVELLKTLSDAGAALDQADSAGLTPLDYALIRGAPKLAKALQKLLGRRKDKWERPTFDNFEVKDGVTWPSPAPDYKADAEVLLTKFEKAVAEAEKEDSDKPVPDAKLKLGDTGEVVIDEDQDLPYDVLLTKIDVKAGAWGLYNFYKMQVVFQKGKELFILFNTWGRIGDEGQFQQTPFAKKEDCVKEFSKIFKAKTGNAWQNYKTFENKPNKYRLVQAEKRKKNKKRKQLKFELESKVASQLPTSLQDLMREVMDVTSMTKALTRCSIDESMMPLGRIQKPVVLKAKELLKQIKVLVDSIEKRREVVPIADLDAYQAELTEISNLTSEYYHLIPRSGYAFERIAPLDSEDALGNEWNHLNTLLELEVASKMLAGAQHRVKEINPQDYVYRSMNCQLELANEDDPAIQYLLKYIHSSAQSTKVEAIFKVSRPGEEKRLRRCQLEDHRILFHGSSTANLISILNKGLLISPPDAPFAGRAFGRGIYTADMFSKSAGYCYNWSGFSPHKFMLVCQVAMGRQKQLDEVVSGKTPTGFNSLWAMGQKRPNPEYDVVLPSGATVPLGPEKFYPYPQQRREATGQWNWPCMHNEFIALDDSQICIRYVIQFR